MSKRTPSVAVGDILRCIEHIETYIANLAFEEFANNFMVIEACLYHRLISQIRKESNWYDMCILTKEDLTLEVFQSLVKSIK